MAGLSLPTFPTFPVHAESNTAGTRWEKYVKRLENLFIGFGVTDDNRKRALLLHYSGEEVADIFDTLKDTGTDYKTAKDTRRETCSQSTTLLL